MIDFSILSHFGSTNERLKEAFTAQPVSDLDRPKLTKEEIKKREDDVKNRIYFEKLIQARTNEHIAFSLRNYQLYAAVDMAWDSTPITKSTLPLLLYAQGKLNATKCAEQLAKVADGSQYVKKDAQGQTAIDLPRFVDVNVNLIRHIITRRVAAQANKYQNLWPYYKYESRSTAPIARLRADAVSMRMDVMADQFGMRHHDVQCVRDAFLYGHTVDFVRCSWETYRQWRKKDYAEEFTDDKTPEMESYVVKEGVAWVNPHPTRVYWDNAWPLSSINSDTGCRYIGFWDIQRYGDLLDNPYYFNRDAVRWSSTQWGYYAIYSSYFANYFSALTPPPSEDINITADPAGQNDRSNNIGSYSGEMRDTSVFLTNHFEKIVPKDCGLGNYPYEVWVRFVFAGDNTIVYAEFLPSTPAAYLGLNENDSRQVNISFAHELMPWQDAMNNLMNQLLQVCELELLKIVGINTDMIPDGEVRASIIEKLKGKKWTDGPIAFTYSESKALEQFGTTPKTAVQIAECKVGATITNIFEAMAKLVALAEKLIAMSPSEMGQPAPREISATEVSQMSATTTSVYSFISDGIDFFREAKKRVLYESYVSKAEGNVRVPVLDRYPKGVIEKAGFTIPPEELSEEAVGVADRRAFTIVGSPKLLIHEYIFSSRDGAERPSNTQSAQSLVQLLGVMLPIPTMLESIGKKKLYTIVNEIFRLSGTTVDLNLEIEDGEEDGFGPSEMQQLQEIIGKLAEALKGTTQDVQQLQQIAGELKQAQEREKKPVALSIPYKDSPPDIKRQMEAAAGFNPSQLPPGETSEATDAAAELERTLAAKEAEHQQNLTHKAEDAVLKAL